MAVRIAQISDTHLSGSKRHFVANFEHTATELRERRPDLLPDAYGDIRALAAEHVVSEHAA